jgi:hypothetical protein
MTAEFESVTGELEKRRAGSANSESEPRAQTEAQAPALRRDLHQQNGHTTSKPESSAAVRPTSQAKAADHSVQNATELERTRPEPNQTAPRHPGQVQQYNFDHPISKPAPREASSSRKRRQP